MSLVNKRAIRDLVRDVDGEMRVSSEYIETLEAHLRGQVLAHVRATRKRTLKADVFLGVAATGRRRR